MANIAPANFAYVNANGDKGDVQVLSDADITLLNEGLQDIEDLKLAIQKPLPAGTMLHYAGNVVPEGFLICNGAAVSRTTYASLFTAIGTLYGTGDGSTTFNLPDARDRVLQGASGTHSTGSYISAGLPNIGGRILDTTGIIGVTVAADGAFYDSAAATARLAGTAEVAATYGYMRRIQLDANRVSSIYRGGVATVQPPAVSSYILIKI